MLSVIIKEAYCHLFSKMHSKDKSFKHTGRRETVKPNIGMKDFRLNSELINDVRL